MLVFLLRFKYLYVNIFLAKKGIVKSLCKRGHNDERRETAHDGSGSHGEQECEDAELDELVVVPRRQEEAVDHEEAQEEPDDLDEVQQVLLFRQETFQHGIPIASSHVVDGSGKLGHYILGGFH